MQAVRADPTPPPEQERVRSTDQVNLAVDTTHSRHAGNVYVAYLECAGSAPRGPCANENESVIHVVRSTDHGRTFSAAGGDRGPRGPLHEHAGSRRGTRRHGARHVPHLPDRRAAADLDRALDRRRRARSRPRNWSPGSRRSTPTSSRSRPAEALQCGDGPFACPSGFTFPSFSELRPGHGGPERRPRDLEPGAGERPEQGVRPHLARRRHVDRAPGADRRRAEGSPVVARHRLRRAASSRRCSSTRGATRPMRPTGRRATRRRERTPGRRWTRTSPARATAAAPGRSDGSAGSRAPRTTRPTSRRGSPGTATASRCPASPAPASSPPGPTRATWCPATTRGPTAARTASTSTPRARGPRTPSRDRRSATRRPRTPDPCLDQGGLDLNIYGAWVGRGRGRSH